MSKSSVDDLVEAGSEYHAGFVTDVESETLPKIYIQIIQFLIKIHGEFDVDELTVLY